MLRVFDSAAVTGPGSGGHTTLEGESRDAEPSLLQPGVRLGRYEVLEKLGQGSMGVVYAAYDPELDRRVALKLLRAHAGVSPEDGRHVRLQREAQALARLIHPNVVAVHDVGTFEDRVFVAMEYVDGGTLREWIAQGDQEPRPWAQLRETFVAAGRGLAAVHAAGIVHRDFKPDNVLIGRDGRVRVTDFGLAQLAQEQPEPQPETDSEPPVTRDRRVSGDVTASRASLTETGVMVGTPAYMAPEQFRGAASSAASDQFSYCTALYEALYAERPFPAKDLTQLVAKVMRGEPSPPPRRAVPAGVRRAVLKGLSRDPSQRFADMDALLAELSNDRARTRRRVAVACLGASLGAGALWVALDNGPPPCTGDGLRETWHQHAANQARDAFAATQVPYAEVTWSRVEPRLDAYVDRWAQLSLQSCTEFRSGAKPRLAVARANCLASRRRAVEASVALFLDPDKQTVRNAHNVVTGLGSPQECAQDEHLVQAQTPPPAPDQLVAAAQHRRSLARAIATGVAGHHAAAVEQLKQLHPQVTELGYLPLMAEVVVARGRLLAQAGKPEGLELLYEGVALATEARDPELAARGWVQLVYVLMLFGQDDAGLRRALRQSEAAVDAHNDARLRVGWLVVRASVEQNQGKPEVALASYSEALALYEQRGDRFGAATVRLRIARLGIYLGRIQAAKAELEQVLAVMSQEYGAQHPDTADAHSALGELFSKQLNYAKAEAALRLAADGLEQSMGPKHPDTAMAQASLALVLVKAGKVDEAVELGEEALAVMLEVVGATHPAVAWVRQVLADVYADAGRDQAALEQIELALTQPRPAVPGLIKASLLAVRARVLCGDSAAVQPAQQALAIVEAQLGAEHATVVGYLDGLGQAYLCADQPVEALVALDHALNLAEGREHEPAMLRVRFHWAQAASSVPALRERATAVAQQVAQALREVSARDAQEVEAWLASDSASSIPQAVR